MSEKESVNSEIPTLDAANLTCKFE